MGGVRYLTPLDKILNGIHYQDRRKFRDTYDYYYAKMSQFETTMDQLTKGISDKLASNYLFYRYRLNTVKIKTTAVNPATNRDGSWVEIGDRVQVSPKLQRYWEQPLHCQKKSFIHNQITLFSMKPMFQFYVTMTNGSIRTTNIRYIRVLLKTMMKKLTAVRFTLCERLYQDRTW